MDDEETKLMNQNIRDNQDDVIEIDLVELLGVVLHNLWLIIMVGIITAAATFLVNFFLITPKYESVTKIYVISKANSDAMTYSDLQAGMILTKDYKELVKSRPVLEEVIAETGINTEIKSLEGQITVEVPTDTRIVSIKVQDKDPYQARIIADSVRIAAAKHIQAVMDTEAVNVVEEANLPIEKSSPHKLKNTIIGYWVGIFLAMAIVIAIYIMDDTIKTPDDVEKYLGVSILGTIPYSENDLSDKADMAAYKKKSRKKNNNKSDNDEKVFEPSLLEENLRIEAERRKDRREQRDRLTNGTVTTQNH